MERAARERNLLPALTGARFIAGFMIVLHHGHGTFPIIGQVFAHFPLNSGVSFFFILSGFILAYSYPSLPDKRSAVDFWVKRFARIWPVHLATLCLLILTLNDLSPGGTINSSASFLANLTLTQVWFSDYRYVLAFNGVSWSIGVEAFFYAVFPFLIWNLRKTWQWKLAGCAALVFFLCLVGNDYQNMDILDPAWQIPHAVFIQFQPLARLFEFASGVCLYLLWRRHLSLLTMKHWWGVEIAAILAIIVTWYLCVRLTPAHVFGPVGQAWFYHAGAFIIAFGILIITLATSKGPVATILGSRPFVFLGEISFALYMVHQIVIRWMHENDAFSYLTQGRLGSYVAASIIAAIILKYLVEKPAQKAIVSTYKHLTAPGLQRAAA